MIVTRSTLTGVDIPISKVQKTLHDTLIIAWSLQDTDYMCYPRCYRNQTEDGYIPELWDEEKQDYSDALLDDKKAALSFFGINSITKINVESIANVHLIFFVDLNKVKPGNSRDDEGVRTDVLKILHPSPNGFILNRQVTSIDQVLLEYPAYRTKDALRYRDMHPFHCFRFDMEIRFNPTLVSCIK